METFTDEDDAVAIANDTIYGLAGAVSTQDAGHAQRDAHRLRNGTVWINDYHPYVPQAEWGGYKQSGVGRELGRAGLSTSTARPSTSGGTCDPRAALVPGTGQVMKRFDYVIVGGGSAGCAIANRLSEDAGTTVLLFEAGRSDVKIDPFIHMPAALPFPIGSRLYDWRYETDPKPDHGVRRGVPAPAARSSAAPPRSTG